MFSVKSFSPISSFTFFSFLYCFVLFLFLFCFGVFFLRGGGGGRGTPSIFCQRLSFAALLVFCSVNIPSSTPRYFFCLAFLSTIYYYLSAPFWQRFIFSVSTFLSTPCCLFLSMPFCRCRRFLFTPSDPSLVCCPDILFQSQIINIVRVAVRFQGQLIINMCIVHTSISLSLSIALLPTKNDFWLNFTLILLFCCYRHCCCCNSGGGGGGGGGVDDDGDDDEY